MRSTLHLVAVVCLVGAISARTRAQDAETNVDSDVNAGVESDVNEGEEAEVTRTEEASAFDEPDVPASAFVIFSPDWMPIVTLGYRAERLWWKDGRLSDAPGHEDPSSLHGLTGSLLLPVLASGRPASTVRLALGLGAGVDFAMGRGTGAFTPRSYEPGTTPPPPLDPFRILTIQVHAQLGLILRAAPRGRGFLGSLLWLPTSRNFRYAVTERPNLRDRVRTLARARLTLGWVHDHLYVSIFTGFAQSGSDGESPRLAGRERIVDVGLQVGCGW